MLTHLKPARAWLILVIVLLLTALAYGPGLHGGFLFDDFANLPALGDSGPIDNWAAFWRYITSGTADPTGRPLTLLTFLLNARHWPTSPLPFKSTNLALHLFNGVLLYALLVRLGNLITDARTSRSRIAALIGTALWLLHPLLVSTTLYIVQREAILPATCVLAGLLIWLRGRRHLAEERNRQGVASCVIGLGVFTFLGVLSKANGALLPLYALLIEIILLRKRQAFTSDTSRRLYRNIMRWLGIAPALAVLLYLVYIGVHGMLMGGNASGRSWTYAQRLLTEPRIVMDYLSLLWLPRPFSSGLFNDQYLASTSLWQPLSTLFALLALIGLISYGYVVRRKHPALALAILFFFTGHLMESTSIPLELYYEHRNYVPALLMFWPLGLWLADLRFMPAPKYVLMVVLPIGLASMTYLSAQIWGNEKEQALIWAHINPDSPRAQTRAAQVEMESGAPRKALQRLEEALQKHPDEPQIALNMLGARCMTGGISSADMEEVRTTMLSTSSMTSLFTHWFDRVLPTALNGSCPGFTVQSIQSVIDAGLQNSHLNAAGFQQDFIYARGRIALVEKKPDLALGDFTEALNREVRPAVALEGAATLGAAGYPRYGLCLLEHYQHEQDKVISPGMGMPVLHAWILKQQNYWPNEIDHLRQQLLTDVKSADPASSQSQCEGNPDR
jgi:tetratricopeptide (TPR) repeat protein